MKLFAETLQQKLDDQEKSTKQIIGSLKKDNQLQSELMSKLKDESSKYKAQIAELNSKLKLNEEFQASNQQLKEKV